MAEKDTAVKVGELREQLGNEVPRRAVFGGWGNVDAVVMVCVLHGLVFAPQAETLHEIQAVRARHQGLDLAQVFRGQRVLGIDSEAYQPGCGHVVEVRSLPQAMGGLDPDGELMVYDPSQGRHHAANVELFHAGAHGVILVVALPETVVGHIQWRFGNTWTTRLESITPTFPYQ